MNENATPRPMTTPSPLTAEELAKRLTEALRRRWTMWAEGPDDDPRPLADALAHDDDILATLEAASKPGLDEVVAALTSEDEIAHGEAWDDARKRGLGVCAYCDRDWPCHTQQAIDRLLARLAGTTEEPR